MKKLLLTYLLLFSLIGFSQDTIPTTPKMDSLLIEMYKLMQKKDSLENRMDSLCKKSNSIYLDLTTIDTIDISEEDYQYYADLKKQFDIKYSDLIDSDNFPNSKPIEIDMYKTVGFGKKVHPIYRTSKFHNGIDIPAKKGTLIKATMSGKFGIESELPRPCGKYVVIEKNRIKTVYMHMDSVFVNHGDYIEKGQVIGMVGSTGRSTQNHLHYEILIDDLLINPIFALFSELNKSELNLILTKNGMSMD